jgi:hypothetical protein
MTTTLHKDDRVKITNVFGFTDDEQLEANFKLVGQEGFVSEVINHEWLHVLVPSHRFYSKDKGAMLRVSEVEAL